VLLPESKYPRFLLGFVCDHTQPAYGVVVESDKASDAVSDPVDLHTHWFPKECKMYLALCSYCWFVDKKPTTLPWYVVGNSPVSHYCFFAPRSDRKRM
jgi:hypothetical protein